MSVTAELEKRLGQFKTAPFLFVGSGISRRYLTLETWGELLAKYANTLSPGYGFYLSKANSDLPKVASLIAEDFHAHWWRSTAFADNRTKYAKDATRQDSPLKIEISNYLKTFTISNEPALQEEIKALSTAVIDGVITTNWDLLLEKVFADFEVYRGQDQLLFSNPQSIAEIYKIHGCCTLPNSLVLTSEDYQEFGDRNPYLASKLLTIFIEHPVLFLGYSLSDPNIIAILTAITKCFRSEALNVLRDRLLFVNRLKEGEINSFSPSVLSQVQRVSNGR
jgi:hypothetical protein